MENKFYIDDFERYVKEKADEFKMYPSKRVWNSIYNGMHPGSRWPSISMCLVLIGTLFLVGFLNTNTTTNKIGRNSVLNEASASSISNSANTVADPDKTLITQETKNLLPKSNTLTVPSKPGMASVKNNLPAGDIQMEDFNKKLSNITEANKNIAVVPSLPSSINDQVNDHELLINKELNTATISNSVNADFTNTFVNNKIADRPIDDNNIATSSNNSTTLKYSDGFIQKNNDYEILAEAQSHLKITAIPSNVITTVKTLTKPINVISEIDKFWIENYAMYNRPAPKKWKGKLSWQNYIAPSVVYRSLENTAADKNVGLAGIPNNSDINNSITHTPSFGIELGTGLQYDLSKRIKIKTGLQLNFTQYNAHAFDNGHPISTSLTMLSDNYDIAYEVYRISPYNSNYGITPAKLHNQTYQVSIPFGADYKIAAVDNLEWYAGATIQPTFVLGGRSYLISTDRRNYVKESDMLNHFNLNAGFETYISIKTKGGVTWQIGPQFRRQIFSTNSKTYSIEERLLNYGLKIGISKKL